MVKVYFQDNLLTIYSVSSKFMDKEQHRWPILILVALFI